VDREQAGRQAPQQSFKASARVGLFKPNDFLAAGQILDALLRITTLGAALKAKRARIFVQGTMKQTSRQCGRCRNDAQRV